MGDDGGSGRDGRARDAMWPFAVFGGVGLLLALVIVPAFLLSHATPYTPPRSAAGIDVQPSDLGSGWSLSSESSFSGPAGLVDYSGRTFQRASAYGGMVFVSSSVEIYNTSASASNRFRGIEANASSDWQGTGVNVGDQGILYRNLAGAWLLFIDNDTVVSIHVGWSANWEDLTGRAFSTEYQIAGDLLVLGRIVDSRI